MYSFVLGLLCRPPVPQTARIAANGWMTDELERTGKEEVVI
jgi:hypothetical protein